MVMSNMHMHAKGHIIPPGHKTRKIDKIDWVKCWCGMHHSNREIPSDYWDKYTKLSEATAKYNCGIILRKKGALFVVQSYNNYYGFPKGSIRNKHESFEVCALREFYEETGHILDLSKHKYRQILLKNDTTRVTYIFFIVSVDDDFDIDTKPIDNMEITSFGWIPVADLPSMRISKITGMACKMLSE
jgi:8-oxo-dGTP pyrophosphatase MutT (NUDIX family)